MEWFISDTHFGHKNIIKYCKRPFVSVIEMENRLKMNWNNLIKKDDVVYHLGDFGLAPKSVLTKICSELNGHKILVRGNHDKSEKSMFDIGFDEVYKYMEIERDRKKIFIGHKPMVSYYHDMVLCGHVHDLFQINGNIVNMSVDVWNYKPIPWSILRDLNLNRNTFQRYGIKGKIDL